MKLKSLEMQGFKSFPDKTLLKFDNGVTIIVGPNGSGKSNITDAMRWVLGELSSKNIRGSKMEDVIFAGASSRSQMSFAEVSVTFDNTAGTDKLATPYDEVTVTRRLYRTGESAYLINRRQVRLRDIYELFMNTGIGREGYSIIGQGRIAEIISKKSEDRRNIFEEAAGISKYRYKKHEASIKLEQVDANMLRAADIHAELEARVGPLEKEAQKARKYLEFFEMKKRADVSLWLYDTEKLRADIAVSEENCTVSAHELEMAEDSVVTLERQNDRLFESSQQNKLSTEKLTARIHELIKLRTNLDEAHRKLSSDQSYRSAMLESENNSCERTRAELSTAVQTRAERQSTIDTLTEAGADIESRLSGKIAEQKALTEKKQSNDKLLEDSLRIQNEREASLTDLRVRISVIKNTFENDVSRMESIDSDVEKLTSGNASLQKEYDSASAAADGYAKMAAKFKSEAAGHNAALTDINTRRDDLRRELSTCSSAAAAVEEREKALTRLEEHFEGYVNSVRFIMQRYQNGVVIENGRESGAIYGPVSRLIDVPGQFTVAIETALGASLQNIVVENEAAAKTCISALKSAGAGRATFYPLTSVTPQNRTYELESCSNCAGFVGYADELIGYDDRYRGVISSLLTRTAVFDSLDSATEAAKRAKFKVKLVTLDGQLINPGGSFTGGSIRRDSGMLTRGAEIAKLKSEFETLREKAAAIEKSLKAADAEYAKLESKRNGLNEQIGITDELYLSQKSEADAIKAKIEANERLVNQIVGDKALLEDHQAKAGDDIAKLEAQSAAVADEIKRIKESRADADTTGYEIADSIDALTAGINALNIRMAEYKKDLEAAGKLLEDADQSITRSQEQIAMHEAKVVAFTKEITDGETLIAENREEYRKYSDELDDREQERTASDTDATELDRRLNEARIKLREITSRKETVLLAHTKNESKLQAQKDSLDKQITRLWDDYELTHAAAVELDYPPVDETNRQAAVMTLNECRSKLKSLGSVNISAIEEYDEVRDRYEKLDVQIKDLKQSRADLQEIIDELEEKMKVDFADAFNRINESFKVVFAELFGGGQAELTLTDPEDILSCGIDIKAAPPGKVIKNMMLLSGGEQAFTAIALLFAILKVNPSPFCIFDEIEAALDEVNIARFADYIKRYSADTQFVVITHRRGTMEAADTLYGVTMPVQGISRVISINPSDIGSRNELLK